MRVQNSEERQHSQEINYHENLSFTALNYQGKLGLFLVTYRVQLQISNFDQLHNSVSVHSVAPRVLGMCTAV